MRKLYFLLLLCCLNYSAMALSTLVTGSTAAATSCAPATNVIIDNFTINQTGSTASLLSVTFATTGTYSSGDVSNYKLWYNTVNNFASATTVGVLAPGGAGTYTFSGLSQTLAGGGTTYYWITVDLPGTATAGDNLTVSAMSSTSITVSAGGTSGLTLAAGMQTIAVTPAPIVSTTSTFFICQGSSIVLTDATSGGTWSSDNVFVATTSGGTITGVGTGTANISYMVGTTCPTTVTVTVNTTLPPSAPFTPIVICADSPVLLSNSVPGCDFTSGSTTIATVGFTTGLVTGASFGTTTITTTLPGTSCYTINMVTVNPLPAPITGSLTTCAYAQNPTTLSDADAGGTWSGGLGLATIAVSTGSAAIGTGGYGGSACGAGVVNIVTYTLPDGCAVTANVTVNPWPASISGSTTLCAGALDSNLYSDACGGGHWIFSPSTVGTVNSLSGWVLGIGAGTGTLTYQSIATGCYNVLPVYVNPFGPIIGPDSFCVSNCTAFTDTTTGGYWSSGSPSIATINATSGLACGITTGIDILTYTMGSTGCSTTKQVTINGLPSGITGAGPICVNDSITLSNSSGGGTWTSVHTGIATVNPIDGVVTGVGTGAGTSATDSILYTVGSTGCIAAAVVTVYANPAPIAGSSTVCVGTDIAMSDATTGGTWSATNGHATVNPTGIVHGVSAGPDTILYSMTYMSGTTTITMCPVQFPITVNPAAGTITGASSLCQFSYDTLSDASTGGSWASSNPSVATVVAPGVIYGTSFGTAVITYTLPTGCYATKSVTVIAPPSPITGTLVLCSGQSSTLSDGTSGGTWWSQHPLVASITSGGIVTAGVVTVTTTDTIFYTSGTTGCSTFAIFTVNPLPATITSTSAFTVCTGSTITLFDATSGGTWTSADATIAAATTVGSNTGVVSGTSLVQATTTVTYTIPTGCYITHTVTVDSLPDAITGSNTLCVGTTTTLSETTTPGSWSSSNTAVAPVGGTNIVTGMSAGTATITFTTVVGGCITTFPVTVNALPGAIMGNFTMCTAQSVTIYDSLPSGGTFIRGDLNSTVTNLGVIGPSSYASVFGITPPGSLISYQLSSSCVTTQYVTINPTPTVSGPSAICTGSCVTFTANDIGGTWIVPSTDAIVSSSWEAGGVAYAIVCGVSPSTSVLIVYSMPSGCTGTTSIEVDAAPAPITGPSSTVCVGQDLYLSDITPGGTWLSSNYSVASVGSLTGVVTGVSPGVAEISYEVVSGTTTCPVVYEVTVNPLSNIYGPDTSVCVGSTIPLYDTTAGGGTWSSSNTTFATIGSTTGLVSGLSAGTDSILFTTGLGCQAALVITVNQLPAPISGGNNVCVGSSILLSDAITPGTWSSSATSIVSVDPTGYATGMSSGIAIVTYTILGTSCFTTESFTVYPVAVISGPPEICVGVSTVYSATPTGGTWTSSDGAILTINPTTGVASGVATGVATISYTLSSGCVSTLVVTVTTVASILPTSPAVCVGLNLALSDATSGGVWSSYATGIASIDPVTGVAHGVSAGTTPITYSISPGCYALTSLIVNPRADIMGPSTVCQYETITLVDTVTGGTWYSPITGIATVDPITGVVTGVTPGVVTIYYTISATGCSVSKTITVNAIPPIVATTLTHIVCLGSTLSLVIDTTGGTWSASNSNASVSSGGVVTGLSLGVDTITYTRGCIALYVVTVSPSPLPIVGPATVCAWGSCITLADASGTGVWSSTLVTVTWQTGDTAVVCGAAPGTGVVTYTLPTGCYTTFTVTTHPLPASIAGTSNLCQGTTMNVTDATSGGTWYSTAPGIASVSSSGVVTGVSPGSATIDYVMPDSCFVTFPVTVNPNQPIVGPAGICSGQTGTFSDPLHGGVWSISSGASITTIVVDSEIVVTAGTTTTPITVTLTYSFTATGCTSTFTFNVEPMPAPISGATFTLCQYDSILLTDATSGGTWSSGTPAIDTVDHLGWVFGTGSGVGSVTYTVPFTIGTYTVGCSVSAAVTVNAIGLIGVSTLAGVIIPANMDTNICIGVPTTLTDAVSGGTWSPTSTTLATLDASLGVIVGTAVGTEIVTYQLPSGCLTALTVNIYPQPVAIISPSGYSSVCVNNTLTLTEATTGGTWSSSATGIASINAASGVVTGVAAGTATIYYIMPSGCYSSFLVTVNPLPAAITGPNVVCGSLSITLGDITPVGTWSVTPTTLGTINPATGTFTAAVDVGGTAIISYGIAYTGAPTCVQTYSVTVLTFDSIVGPAHICQGIPTLFTDVTYGGSWSSSAPSVIYINSSTGVATGMTLSNATLSYHIPPTGAYSVSATGCTATKSVTVNVSPGPISGPGSVCVGQEITLSDATAGGTWTSHDITRATIGSSSGIVDGISSGTVIITYSFGSGCRSIATVIVNPFSAIVGTTSALCDSTHLTLTDATPGGHWTSSNTSIAIVSLSTTTPVYTADVYGIHAGSDTIYYTISATGCTAAFPIVVDPLPAMITGVNHVCRGDSTLLADATPGGTWSITPVTTPTYAWPSVSTPGMIVSNPAIDIGVTTPLNHVVTVVYTLPTGCKRSESFTVFPIPDPMTGVFTVCQGATTILYDDICPNTAAGTLWVCSSPSAVSITALSPCPPSAAITGLTVGTTTISYYLPGGNCYVTHLFEVYDTVRPVVELVSSLGDTISVLNVDSICAGSKPIFTVDTLYGGYSPILNWYVNGVYQSSGYTYSYVPLAGDTVRVKMTSNATCATPVTVSDYYTMELKANTLDAVSITSSADATHDTICMGVPVLYSATGTGAGAAPTYYWTVNGVYVGTGTTYLYTPSFFDIVQCYLISSAACPSPDTAASNQIDMYVRPGLVDNFNIYATPSSTVRYYDPITFYSEGVNFGSNPTYQWYVNYVPVTGATNSSFYMDTEKNGDLVFCVMYSSNPCTTVIPDTSNKITILISNVGVDGVANGFSEVALVPNPNKGNFRLKGFMNSVSNDNVDIEIADMLGKVLYKKTVQPRNGKLDVEIALDDIATGMYYLKMTSGSESDVRHFVVDK